VPNLGDEPVAQVVDDIPGVRSSQLCKPERVHGSAGV